MVDAAQYATPREMYDRYNEIHRKFFPPHPPSVPEPPPVISIAAAEPPPPDPLDVELPLSMKVIGFQQTRARMRVIRRAVCLHFGITKYEMVQKRRTAKIVIPRQVFSYFSARLTGASLTQIAKTLDQDHTTVMHAVESIKGRILDHPEFHAVIECLEQKIMTNFGDLRTNVRIKFGRYVPHSRVNLYLQLGWVWSQYINIYGVLMIWPCGCPCVEPPDGDLHNLPGHLRPGD